MLIRVFFSDPRLIPGLRADLKYDSFLLSSGESRSLTSTGKGFALLICRVLLLTAFDQVCFQTFWLKNVRKMEDGASISKAASILRSGPSGPLVSVAPTNYFHCQQELADINRRWQSFRKKPPCP
jgi:hypothetical protein